jgi:hypothetical protein
MIYVNHFHAFLMFIKIVLKLRMGNLVVKRVWIVSILLYTLIQWVRLDEFSNFLLKICFFLIYVSCFHVNLWNLWNLVLIHLIIAWWIICIVCPWRWRTVILCNWIFPIPLKDRKFKDFIFKFILLVYIIIAHFGGNSLILFIVFTISIYYWWSRL